MNEKRGSSETRSVNSQSSR